jgi:hypothetical protein
MRGAQSSPGCILRGGLKFTPDRIRRVGNLHDALAALGQRAMILPPSAVAKDAPKTP